MMVHGAIGLFVMNPSRHDQSEAHSSVVFNRFRCPAIGRLRTFRLSLSHHHAENIQVSRYAQKAPALLLKANLGVQAIPLAHVWIEP